MDYEIYDEENKFSDGEYPLDPKDYFGEPHPDDITEIIKNNNGTFYIHQSNKINLSAHNSKKITRLVKR